MFTPSRSNTPISTGSSRRRTSAAFSLTPRRSQLPGSKTRRSHLISRQSPADSLGHGSPAVPTAFSTANYAFVNAGSSLPVLVNEAISQADRYVEITAEISENGWAWLVCGRKLFVWRYRQKASKNALCKEFSLPSLGATESAHKSSLIYTGKPGNSSDDGVVSLLVVTSLGSVRFWPNIIQSISAVVETALDGVGASSPDEECFKLIPLDIRGYLVGTTKGSLFHLFPSTNTMLCTKLQVSQGMLSGIGRRVSSFFFSSPQEPNLKNFITLRSSPNSPPEIIMLTTTALQRWRLSSLGEDNGTDHMLSQVNLNALLVDSIAEAIWNAPAKDFRMWILDMALASRRNHVALLIAVTDMGSRSGGGVVLRYVVCICPSSILKEGTDTANAGMSVDVLVLDHSEFMQNENESPSFLYRMLIPNDETSAPEQAILWRDDNIFIKSLLKGNSQSEDAASVGAAGDNILGVGRLNGCCIVLTKTNGLLVINSNASSHSHISQGIEDSILLTPSSSKPQTPLGSLPGTPVVSKAKIEQLECSESGSQRLQAAFIHFNRMNTAQAKSIVEESFGLGGSGGNMDESVVIVSQELIDDYPAQDPRWAESVPQDSGTSSSSLILLHQLEDKQKAHELYLNFLTEVGIWEHLSTVVDNARKTCTRWLMFEHGEKLAAAIALRQRHIDHQGVVDAAIRKVLEKRDRVLDRRGLTPQDVFYREVSRVQEILGCLLDTEEDVIGNSILSSREIFTAVAGVNEIFEAMLSSACQYRKSKRSIKQVSGTTKDVEFMPWTVASGRHSIREVAIRQHEITVSRGLPEAEDGQQRAVLHSHLVALADLVLDGYLQQMESVQDSHVMSARRDEIIASYKRHRTNLIMPILDAGLIDKAAMLAEKYHDFGILVELCDRNGYQDRLSKYMADFASQGFSDFLFNWYLERGKFRSLLECTSSSSLAVAEYDDKLSDFLSSHPKIAWLHQIKTNDFMAAHNTLQYLAAIETASAVKKNNLLSLSKLSAVFSSENEDLIEQKVEAINTQQILLRYQETLPQDVLEKHGMTIDNMPVFPAHKLIELYVCDENTCSNEVDFKKALDLLQFLPQDTDDDSDKEELESGLPDAEEMKLFIWCRAILKDSWDIIEHGSDPLEACKNTIFAKTLMLSYDAGILEDCLPDVENLLEQDELGLLRESASSQYLIRAWFEHIHRMMASAQN